MFLSPSVSSCLLQIHGCVETVVSVDPETVSDPGAVSLCLPNFATVGSTTVGSMMTIPTSPVAAR
jgi:hypothetical protein